MEQWKPIGKCVPVQAFPKSGFYSIGTPLMFKKTWKKKVRRKKGLLVWRDKDKKELLKRVKNGTKVRVMCVMDWYARVLLADGSTGFMNKKCLK